MESIHGASATLTDHEPVRAAVFRSAGFSPQGGSVGTLLRTKVRAPAGGRFMESLRRSAWLALIAGIRLSAQELVLEEEFSGTAIQNDLWTVTTPFANSRVAVADGRVRLSRRGGLQAKVELPDAMDLTARLRFVGDADRLTFAWRSDLSLTNQMEVQGLHVVLGLPDQRVYLSQPFVRNFATNLFRFNAGTEYPVRITDDGRRVQVFVEDLFTPVLAAEADHRLGRRLAVYDGLDTDSATEVDYLRVRPWLPSVFVDGELVYSGPVKRAGSARIALQPSLPGSTLFYTTDGSTPDFARGTEYREPIELEGRHTIRVVEYSSDFLDQRDGPTIELDLTPVFALRLDTAGGGRVELDPPGGSYDSNAVVRVRAVADPDWQFLRWDGDLSGEGATNEIQVNAPLRSRAVFGTRLRVTSLPASSIGVATYPATDLLEYGAVVKLMAIPEEGYAFARWAGAVSGTATPVDLVMTNGAQAVTVLAVRLEENQVTVVPRVEGPGRLVVKPPGSVFQVGDTIEVQAVPDALGRFLGWGGTEAGQPNPLKWVLSGSVTILARFEPVPLRFDLRSLRWSLQGVRLAVLSEAGTAVHLESSEDFERWTNRVVLTNEAGSVAYQDNDATNAAWRFYRSWGIPAAP